ncbi:LysR family transcriptional regulator [Rhodopseudomonas boonkerdii]|nr:LysR family transcriptional regulator [Rhodopseudomonas boonkerdii]
MTSAPHSHLAGITAFVQAVDAGSFTGAAARIGLSKSAVAKNVARLEERIGVRLLERTTRRLGLTAEGRTYYESCLKIITELNGVESVLAAGRHEVNGLLRVSLPVSFGPRWIMPILLQVARRHPALRLDVSFTDRRVDLIDDGIDLVVRIGDPGDMASLAGRRIGSQNSLICGAPAYLDLRGRPMAVTDLPRHDCIVYARDGRALPWELQDAAGMPIAIRPTARHTVSHGEALRDTAIAGAGIAYLATWLVADDLNASRLEALSIRSGSEAPPIHVLWPHARGLPPKVRVVVDELVEHFLPVPPWDRQRN